MNTSITTEPAVRTALPAAASLAGIGSGFTDAPHHAQQVFRCVLEAMSRPGTVQRLPQSALAGIAPPQALQRGIAAVLLALLDVETSLHLAPGLRDEATAAWLRFHTGVRLAEAASAGFTAAPAAWADAAVFDLLPAGTERVPQDSATLVLDVPALDIGPRGGAVTLRLEGPGIQHTHTLSVGGAAPAFWRARRAAQALFPCGIDLLLCCGDRIAAIPRSTHITLED